MSTETRNQEDKIDQRDWENNGEKKKKLNKPKRNETKQNKNPSLRKHPWIIQMQFPFKIRLFVNEWDSESGSSRPALRSAKKFIRFIAE